MSIFDILARRQSQSDVLEEQRRQREWEEGQVWPDLGRKVLGGLLGGGIKLGMDRLGEEWLPSKIAEQELTALKIAEKKRLAEKAKFDKDVGLAMTGEYTPTERILQSDYGAQEALMKSQVPSARDVPTGRYEHIPAPSTAVPDTELGLAQTADLRAQPYTVAGMPTAAEMALSPGIYRPETRRIPAGRQPTREEIEAATPQTMTKRDRQVMAASERKLEKESFAKSQAAAATAARFQKAMKDAGHVVDFDRKAFDSEDFTTFYRRKAGIGRRRKRVKSPYTDPKVKAMYELSSAPAERAARNGIRVNGKRLIGEEARMHIVINVGGPRYETLQAQHQNLELKAENQLDYLDTTITAQVTAAEEALKRAQATGASAAVRDAAKTNLDASKLALDIIKTRLAIMEKEKEQVTEVFDPTTMQLKTVTKKGLSLLKTKALKRSLKDITAPAGKVGIRTNAEMSAEAARLKKAHGTSWTKDQYREALGKYARGK